MQTLQNSLGYDHNPKQRHLICQLGMPLGTPQFAQQTTTTQQQLLGFVVLATTQNQLVANNEINNETKKQP